MKPLSDVVACVVDHGQFMDVATRLSKDIAHVYYCCPSERACPVISEGILGDGFDEFEKVDDFWSIKNDIDLFVFPDIGFVAEQTELVSQGFPVWGSGRSSLLESQRGKFFDRLKNLDLPVPEFNTVTGIENLRVYLKDKTDKYIKISRWRGDMETFHWRSWKEDSYVLSQWAVRFGPAGNHLTFYILEPISADVEDGFDTYVIDGDMPSTILHGQENKDKSFIGVMTSVDDLPDNLKQIAETFVPSLKDYRSAFSIEARGEYFTDPTMRFPSPPHQLFMEMTHNFSEIIWHGANGELVEPEISKPCGVQALVCSDRDKDEWAMMDLPKKVSDYVYPMFACKLDGVLCFPPGGVGSMLAWITGTGDTVEEAIRCLQKRKSELPDGVSCEDKSIADLLIDLNDNSNGVKLPEPSIVLEST